MKNFKKVVAFTLAEVLITLSILGVVAAITVPSLMKRQHRNEVETKLKKNLSAFEEAINLAILENGPISSWSDADVDDVPEQGKTFKKYIAKYVNVANFDSGKYSIYNPNGQYLNEHYGSILKDGTLVLLQNMSGSNCTGNYGCGYLMFDINGKKGPNRRGKDIFVFLIYKVSNQSNDVSIGKGIDSLSYDDSKNLCYSDPNSSMLGFWCGTTFVKNGYKFPSDYPFLK